MIMKIKEEDKDLNYWKNNCEEDYIKTPISVLRYITELEKAVNNGVLDDVMKSCEGNCGMNYCNENGCIDNKRNLSDPIKLPEDVL